MGACRLTSQWSGRLRAAHSGAAHRRVRRRLKQVVEFGAPTRQGRALFRSSAQTKKGTRRIAVSMNGPSNALRYLFHCRVGCVSGKAQPEHCVLRKHLPWALMRSRSASHLLGFIPRGKSRLKHRWRAGHQRVPGFSAKKHLTNLSVAPEVGTNGSSPNLEASVPHGKSQTPKRPIGPEPAA